MHSVWVALGLFVALWWTWIGFAVLYNRLGADGRAERLLFLAGSVPARAWRRSRSRRRRRATPRCSRSASLSGAHSCSPGAHVITRAGWREALPPADRAVADAGSPPRCSRVSIWVPEPWRYVLWAIAIARRVGRAAARGPHARRASGAATRDLTGVRGRPTRTRRWIRTTSRSGSGLFVIILLGEVVVEAGQAVGRRARRDVRRLGGAGRGDDPRRRRCGGCTSTRRPTSTCGCSRRLGRLADDGAGDLRRRAHAAVLRAAPDGRGPRAAARGGPAADRLHARLRSGWASTCSGPASSSRPATGSAARCVSCCSSRPSRCTACTP